MSAREKVAEELVADHVRRRLARYGQVEAARNLPRHVRVIATGVTRDETFSRRSFEVYLRVSDGSVTLNARDGSLLGWSLSLLAEGGDEGELDRDVLLRAATAVAEPPAGSVLASAGFDRIGDVRCFLARWEHVEAGLAVERDFIQVAVNPATGRVFSLSKRWHDVRLEPTDR